MYIRQYQDADFNRLAEIYDLSRADEFYAEEGDFIFTPWAEDEYMMSVFSQSNIYVYEEEEVVGFCGFTGTRINWLFVDPFFRARGIGYELLSHVLTKLENGATLSVWKSNERAKRIYNKQGFKITGEFPVYFQGQKILVNKMFYQMR